MRSAPLVALMLLSGCMIQPPAVEKDAAPVVVTCPAPPPPPMPVWPDKCAEDWYAKAELPACVKDWITDLSAQQKAIAKKQKKRGK